MLEPQHRRRLLTLAAESIRNHLEKRDSPTLDGAGPPLDEPAAVFVTLRRMGALRGCVGLVERTSPLWQGVRDMAVAAASRDARFKPLRLSELEGLSIEISILSELERIQGPDDIAIGRHGIYLTKGSRSGLLLPQVATEHRWGPLQFLERTSVKAGLSSSSWKTSAGIFVFSCEIIDGHA
ncbi:MAG: AmmeMemoRadiSam system protein A [Planctomycetota bacterium]|nr:AmmeMemoRadiSam system protein A [Planctomycetota bacterium]